MNRARTIFVTRFFLIICTIATVLSTTLKAQDDCSKLIPSSGAYRIVSSQSGTKTFTSSKDWFCSDDFLQYAEDHHASGGVSVPTEYGVANGTFDSHNQQQLTQRNQFCSDSAKVFSKSSDEFLFIKEGDPTLVKGFTECLDHKRKQFLSVIAKQETSNVFTVSVGAQYYPGPEPSILSVTPVDGAIPVIVKSFEPQTKIPFNAAPLTGTFKFSDGSTDAMVLVSTTLGDESVTIKKCRKGTAGTWQVVGAETLTREESAGTYAVSYQLPQAGCHPHCGDGDTVTRDMAVSGDMVIRNPKFSCAGAGCVFDVDQRFAQLTDQHIQFLVRVRSASDNYKLTADQFKRVPYTQDKVLSKGDLTFDNTVSFVVPSGAQLRLNAAWGIAIVTSEMLKANNLGLTGNWLQSATSPQLGPDGVIYTFKVIDGACAQ